MELEERLDAIGFEDDGGAATPPQKAEEIAAIKKQPTLREK
jgi:hypothetical protein